MADMTQFNANNEGLNRTSGLIIHGQNGLCRKCVY